MKKNDMLSSYSTSIGSYSDRASVSAGEDTGSLWNEWAGDKMGKQI